MSSVVFFGAGGVIIAAVAFKMYLKATTGRCTSQKKLTGKVTVVTGANSGIGFYTALDFAKRGAKVYMLCRSEERGSQAVCDVVRESGNAEVQLILADTASMTSVRRAAADLLRREKSVHILVNNAGGPDLSSPRKRRNNDEGMEMTWAANHFGHFLLTNLLLDALKAGAPSRVVNVSSIMHRWGSVDPEWHLDPARPVNPRLSLYSDTKLANILFTRSLASKFEDAGIRSFSLHPGGVATNIWHQKPRGVVFRTVVSTMSPFFKTSEEGAQTSIFCAVDESLDSGQPSGGYYVDCQRVPDESLPAQATDADLAERLWVVSLKLTGPGEGAGDSV